MELEFNSSIATGYKSKSQKARIITESWMCNNMYCPICGSPTISHFKANRPVADFFCPNCESEYELKSSERKTDTFQRIIPNGAYATIINRITSLNNPHLFVMSYYNERVNNLVLIPNFFFVPSIIIKRQPLGEQARRAGWVGSNINIGLIPNQAKIPIIIKGEIISPDHVINNFNRLKTLQTKSISSRGWLIETLKCIDKIPSHIFSLKDVYKFEEELKEKYPSNNFIKDKLRQQLQFLRDKGMIEFLSRGLYRKTLILDYPNQ